MRAGFDQEKAPVGREVSVVVSRNDVRVDQSRSGEQLSCVIRWPHALGGDAHCLARLVVGAGPCPLVACGCPIFGHAVDLR